MITARIAALLALFAVPACTGSVHKGTEDTSVQDKCLPAKLKLDSADATWTGPGSKDHMGQTVIGDIDMNADGTPDLVTASSTASTGGTFAGLVSVATGPASGDVALSDATANITGQEEYSYFGAAMWVEDFNHDGYAEVLIGAYGSNDDIGAAYVFFGPVEGTMTSADADATFSGGEFDQAYAGTSIAGGGDFDLDGFGDFAVGAPGVDVTDTHGTIFTGAVVTYQGSISPGEYLLTDYYNFFYAEQSGDDVGSKLAVADLDGDGGADLVIGAQEYYRSGTRIGKVYVVYAPFDYAKQDIHLSDVDAGIVGTSDHDRPGADIALPGDVNGDGYGDIFLGVQYGESDTGDVGGSNEGAAVLIYGPMMTERTTAQADATFIGEMPGDLAGSSVSAPGDVNGDGSVDALIGAPGNDDGGTDAGKAYLVYGPFSGSVTLDKADVAMQGSVAGAGAGTDVSGAGDMNSDGYVDLLVGSPGDPGDSSPGKIALINGCAH